MKMCERSRDVQENQLIDSLRKSQENTLNDFTTEMTVSIVSNDVYPI